MKKVLGIDLGTTYSCAAYINEFEQPEVLKNKEGNLTTPSVVFFEENGKITVGSFAKDSSVMYPERVISFIKRSIGQQGFRRHLNGAVRSPEEISSFILKEVVQDAEKTLREKKKLGDDEHIRDVVITCPAYFGVAEREATKKAGEIAGLNVMDIINEPTAAAITYGVTEDGQTKTVLVYDLGGGTFDVTIIKIQPGELRVVCTGGDHNLGGFNWDKKIVEYLAEQYKVQNNTSDDILRDDEARQELSLAVERAKKLLTEDRDETPVNVNFSNGGRVREMLTREKFDELTEDLLARTISLTKDMLKEAEKKGCYLTDISSILLVGGSSKMPQVARRVKSEFGIETKMFDPDESVAKGAAIFASRRSEYNIVIDEIAQKTGKRPEEIRDEVNKGTMDLQEEARKANVPMRGGYLSGDELKIINVSSRSFGTEAYDENDTLRLFNIILRNAEIPAAGSSVFYPRSDNQRTVRINVKESLASDEVVDTELGKDVGVASLTLPEGITRNTEIEITFRLDESGLLHLHAKEMKEGREVEAEFQATGALSEQELSDAIRRNSQASVS